MRPNSVEIFFQGRALPTQAPAALIHRAGMALRRRLVLAVAAGVSAIVLAWGAWFLVGGWRVRAGVAWAREQMQREQYGPARDRLAGLSAGWPRRGEVEYLLGVCESKLGRTDAALDAWAHVPPRSPIAASAALARGRALMMSKGRFIEAEAALRSAARGTTARAAEARWALATLLLWEGRLDEVRALLEAIWRTGREIDRIAALRQLWRLDSVIVAVEEVQPALDHAARGATEDHRVWLARAYLASRYGRSTEAREWLDAILRKNPEDPVAWRADLDWALASEDADEALRALTKLSAHQIRLSEQLSLRAWFAARRNDPTAERAALERLLIADPANTPALDRLASLALQAGQTDRAAMLRERQDAINRDKNRYRWLLAEDRSPLSPDDLHQRADLAERLGRWFEARCWLTLALERDSGDGRAQAALERLARTSAAGDAPAAISLEDLVGESPGTLGGAALAAKPADPRAGRSIQFRDDSDQAGLRFTYHNGESPQHQLPEPIGGGVALLDYDGDGWLDVYLVQGGPLRVSGDAAPEPAGDHRRDARSPSGDRLFHNRRDGTFEDVTDASGIAQAGQGYAFGVTAGDYDGDGRTDLFVTRFGSYGLLHNRGDGTFADATETAGLGGNRDWPTSAAFADFDSDGDLDLYVCHYVEWDIQHPTLCTDQRAPDRHVSCLPLGFHARADHLFRNDGGHFVDITASAGIIDRDGRGLGVVAADLDDDGRIDLFVANDMTANYLFRHRGNLKFEEVAQQAGVACNADGGYQAGMGVACGDLDGDGRPDLAVTNFLGESTTLYHNLGRGIFTDATGPVGLKASTRFLLGFGVTFVDVDNDGCLDLATANGHIHDLRPTVPYAMPAQLLTGDRHGRLIDVTAQSGEVWSVRRIGRGLASADLDNDGRVDLLLVAQNAPMAYLHNKTARSGHFLTLCVEGRTSNRDGIGVRVTITSGGRQQTSWRIGGGSYLSASDPRLHFGLGADRTVDTVEVRWPSGTVQRFRSVEADTGYRIRESELTMMPLKGFR
jgi:tetratricopeptide (TPR) repeat protein